jgi:hypothetical protein
MLGRHRGVCANSFEEFRRLTAANVTQSRHDPRPFNITEDIDNFAHIFRLRPGEEVHKLVMGELLEPGDSDSNR